MAGVIFTAPAGIFDSRSTGGEVGPAVAADEPQPASASANAVSPILLSMGSGYQVSWPGVALCRVTASDDRPSLNQGLRR